MSKCLLLLSLLLLLLLYFFKNYYKTIITLHILDKEWVEYITKCSWALLYSGKNKSMKLITAEGSN